jgi:hypothetical protein
MRLYTLWLGRQLKLLGPWGSQLVGHLGFKWLWFSTGALCIAVSILIRRLRKKDVARENNCTPLPVTWHDFLNWIIQIFIMDNTIDNTTVKS